MFAHYLCCPAVILLLCVLLMLCRCSATVADAIIVSCFFPVCFTLLLVYYYCRLNYGTYPRMRAVILFSSIWKGDKGAEDEPPCCLASLVERIIESLPLFPLYLAYLVPHMKGCHMGLYVIIEAVTSVWSNTSPAHGWPEQHRPTRGLETA